MLCGRPDPADDLIIELHKAKFAESDRLQAKQDAEEGERIWKEEQLWIDAWEGAIERGEVTEEEYFDADGDTFPPGWSPDPSADDEG